ncbi:MAG: hypothetical protein JXA42_10095 [Anaerolineales bacterium]|nr:hypothetical protein [Anaerolineales bacterium]
MMDERYRDLLMGMDLPEKEIEAIFSPVGFADWRSAHRSLKLLADDRESGEALADCLPHLFSALVDAADPDRVLVNLNRYARHVRDRPALYRYLALNPRASEILVTLFAGSQFLTEILLRNPDYLERMVEHKRLAQLKTVGEFYQGAQEALGDVEKFLLKLDAIRCYQQWQLLRVGACDLLALFDLQAVTFQLSNLADALVQVCLTIASERSDTDPGNFTVIAAGKLGGRELNYSSDIDLLFLVWSDAADYRRLGECLIQTLARMTDEGFLYRVDMRLRPWGRSGALISSLDGYMRYLQDHARLWEKQAMLKARVIAGDRWVGEEFLRQVRPLLFNSVAEKIRSDVFLMKKRTEAYLRQQGRDWGEVKLGEGSIRDIEFVTQFLQLAYGGKQPEITSRNTLEALSRLSAFGYLPVDDYRVLSDGYIFLRTIEHHLQMMHYRQTNTLPEDKKALINLAKRLGFQGRDASRQLLARYEQHCTAIRAVFMQYLGSKAMDEPENDRRAGPDSFVREHLSRMHSSYEETFSDRDIERHAILIGQLDKDRLVEVDAVSLENDRWRVTIVAFDYPGELALICGLFFASGLSITDGNVFTYEPRNADETARRAKSDYRRKIVDVFTVRPVECEVAEHTWIRYRDELNELLQMMQAGKRREARGKLASRVAVALRESIGVATALYPIDIEIDNEISGHYSVLFIDAPDTIGFLYELTNALAYHRIYIGRVLVESVGDRVRDTLYITDADGKKILEPDKQRELRAATVLIKHFTHLLPHSPNPETALLHFREFIGQLFRRPNWPDELTSLERPEVLDALARLLGVSSFLWDDFLRMQYANLFPVVHDVDSWKTAKNRDQLQAELEAELKQVHDGPQPPIEDAPWKKVLNAFKDREMFRIDMRHILGHTTEFPEFSVELTDLTEVIVNAVYHLCHQDLRFIYGTPCLQDGRLSHATVCALGKCGGKEMGFASDVELMFIYGGNGLTTGPQVITTAEFYEKLVQLFVASIDTRQEGIFEIDLQLRPYGKLGSLAVSLAAFTRYFAPDGPAWAYERQALVKLRPIAGDVEMGQRIEALRDDYIYTGEPFDVIALRAMRERQVRHHVTGGAFDAKYSPGGLADIEYLVQGLQITHGSQNPRLRNSNTRLAMTALAKAGILTSDDYRNLHKGHTFFRWLIDSLRVVRGNAKDVTVPLPDTPEAAFLARRMLYGSDLEKFQQDLALYSKAVLETNQRLFNS